MRKCEETCLIKYGSRNPFGSKIINEKMKEHVLAKYGVEYTAQIPEVRQKMLEGKKRTAYNKIKTKYEGIYEPLFTLDEYQGTGKYYQWKCVKCGNIFTSMYNNGSIRSRCFNCNPRKGVIRQSSYEREIIDYCKSLGYDAIQGNRSIIWPQELDIVITSKKLAIEINGDYWHSTKVNHDPNYHLNKDDLCEKQGYQLFQFFEYEWKNQKQFIKNKIRAALNIYDEHISAKKCDIKEIDLLQANSFLENNNGEKISSSNIILALFFQNEIIAVMNFLNNEITNYFTIKHICGGASRLLKYYKNVYNPKFLITYADRRTSGSDLYKKLGFIEFTRTSPNICWINSKAKDLIKNVDENVDLSEKGYVKHYDAGKIGYIKIYQ